MVRALKLRDWTWIVKFIHTSNQLTKYIKWISLFQIWWLLMHFLFSFSFLLKKNYEAQIHDFVHMWSTQGGSLACLRVNLHHICNMDLFATSKFRCLSLHVAKYNCVYFMTKLLGDRNWNQEAICILSNCQLCLKTQDFT